MRARSYATTAGKLRILGLSATRGAPTIDLAPISKKRRLRRKNAHRIED
jgi:hypothetical protein